MASADRITATLNESRNLVAIVTSCFVDLIIREAMYVPTGSDAELIESYNKTYAAHGLLNLRAFLYADLVRDAYATIGDKRTDSASIARLVGLFCQPGVAAAARVDYCRPRAHNWVGESNLGTDEERLAFEQQIDAAEKVEAETRFDKTHQAILRDWDTFTASDLFKRIKEARHKAIAHKGLQATTDTRLWNLKDTGIQHGDCEKYIAAAEPILVNLSLLLCNTGPGFDSARNMYAKVAQGFWATCRVPKKSGDEEPAV